MREEVPDYELLQAETVAATRAVAAGSILDLGTGTGETARRVLGAHPGARLWGLDASPAMLSAARNRLPDQGVRLHLRRLEQPLPPGPFELVVSALAIHHLEDPAKASLFRRVAEVLAPGGRFVLGDLVVPADPSDAVTPIDDPEHDKPSSVSEQLGWLREAGFSARVHWRYRDLAVLVGDRPA